MNTLAGGLLGLIAAVGVGGGFVRIAGPVPPRWRLAVTLISGVAIIDWAVMLVLFLGGGVTAVKAVGAGALLLGTCLLVVFRKHLSFAPGLAIPHKSDRWFAAVIVAACALNLFIAVAPSTKIDELHYHMLIPKRVIEDNGLYLYRLPFEAAIFPQTAYQLGLSTELTVGFPEAGNVVSWGLGVALILLIAGVAKDLTGSTTAGWMTGAISAVGLYPAVWYVSSGPHALGDLAMVTACLLALLPDTATSETTANTRLILVCLAAYAAVSTKISNLPAAGTITLIAVYRTTAQLGWRKACGVAAIIWGAFYGPAILWTTLKCGSPLGLATARLFHSRYFGSDPIEIMESARGAAPNALRVELQWLAASFSVGVLVCFGIVAYAACRRERISMAVGGLVCGQAMLILWLLPLDFRFFGGLEFVVLVVGAWIFWSSPFRKQVIAKWVIVLVGLCLPWLAVQAYYARPFLKVDLGLVSREDFIDEYVAFSRDFRALDRLLPANAVLYAGGRIPSLYAPRPVVFTLDDLRGRGPVYEFFMDGDSLSLTPSLSCGKTVYQDASANWEVYRTPGRAPEQGSLKVNRCDVAGSIQSRP
jgi:hypothetical protein